MAVAVPVAAICRTCARSIPTLFRLEGGLESRFLRGAAVVLLLALAVRFYLAPLRDGLQRPRRFLIGVDYVDLNSALPLQWLLIAASLAAAVFVWHRALDVGGVDGAVAAGGSSCVPRAVSALYVRPNEISLQRPFINTHIRATRAAFGLEQRVRELEFKARPESPINTAAHKNLLDNVRLWDWRAFHDTITQIQALRPYYVFNDSDIDRYIIDGQYRQVLLAPRELDIRQLPDARASWINPHFHLHPRLRPGAGRGQPHYRRRPAHLLIEDAPPEVKTPSLKLTRPEIYYGEVMHEPVFVNTAQEEFNYPSGADNVRSRYEGQGRLPHLFIRDAPGRGHPARASPKSC